MPALQIHSSDGGFGRLGYFPPVNRDVGAVKEGVGLIELHPSVKKIEF
jgi:hypothetical protein